MAKDTPNTPAPGDDPMATPAASEPTEVLPTTDEQALRSDIDLRPAPSAAGDSGGLPPVPPARPGIGERIGASWREATSTRGGRIATILAASLATLAVIAAIGLGIGALARGGRGGWDERGWDRSSGQGRHEANNGMRHGNGPGMGGGSVRDRVHHQWQGQGQGGPMGPNSPMGQGGPMGPNRPNSPTGPNSPMGPNDRMGQGGGVGMGAVLHGEFVTALSGTPTAMLIQTGAVTKVEAGKSLTVKSSDGFEATYALTGSTTYGRGGAAGVVTGATVRVLAVKDGAKATLVAVTG